VAAQALYAGLATDTGFFRFGSATARTYAIAAELLDLGAQPPLCYQEIYERNPPAHTRLLGHALSDLRLEAGGAVASIRITRDVVERCGAEDVDTSEMTTVLLATHGVRVALLFREMDAGRVKVSLRSKDELDVHRLASRFGGGGHRNASGIVMSGRLQSVEEEVIRAAAELVAGDL
jgi:phosphoesterase RecJ-like protein